MPGRLPLGCGIAEKEDGVVFRLCGLSRHVLFCRSVATWTVALAAARLATLLSKCNPWRRVECVRRPMIRSFGAHMNPRRLTYGIVLVAIVALATSYAGYAQESPVAHATRVLDLLEAGKFEEVAAEFNAKMAAAMPVSRLRDVWTTVSRQAGARTSIIRQRVVTQATGNVTVVNACQFEKIALTVMVSFDAENKIAGMNITPGTPPAVPSAAPASTRFTEESVTVGSVAAAMVLVHGSGPNDRDETLGPNKPFRDLAWGLADRGIAVLRYEKRTRQHGAKMAVANNNFTVRDERSRNPCPKRVAAT